jgi:hypothetical protein
MYIEHFNESLVHSSPVASLQGETIVLRAQTVFRRLVLADQNIANSSHINNGYFAPICGCICGFRLPSMS